MNCSCTRKSKSLPNHKQTPNNKKTMEDVWKDINLASLTNHSIHSHQHPITTTSNNNMRGVSFQHFLAPPLNFMTKTTTTTTMVSSKTSPSLHSPVTDLNLNTLPDFHFDGTASKMFLESAGNPRDIRNKRMMKNRESAERSRARKQAYIFELKEKVKNLEEENARLKRQQQQACDTAATQQQKKKGYVYRTSTAPF